MISDGKDVKRHRFGLLAQRNFRLLWIGETISNGGSAMAVVGVPLLAVAVLHASTFDVGALAAVAYLPSLIFGLPVGALVDRLPCRIVMISCDLFAAALFGLVPVAAWLHYISIAELMAVQFLAGVADVMFTTAYQVYLPSLVTAEELVEGNSRMVGSAYAAMLGGRSLGGVTAAVVGSAPALLVNAGSFLVSAGCLFGIRAPVRPRAEPRPGGTFWRDLADGVVLVAGDKYLRTMTLYVAVLSFSLDGYQSILIVFLIRVVGLPIGLVGVFMAVSACGAMVGSTLARRATERFGTGRMLMVSALGAVPFALFLPLTERGPRIALYVVGILIASAGVGSGNVIISSFTQRYCPPQMLGRATATMRYLSTGVSPLAALAGGALGVWLGTRNAMWVLITCLALSGTILLRPTLIRRRDLPTSRTADDLTAKV